MQEKNTIDKYWNILIKKNHYHMDNSLIILILISRKDLTNSCMPS